MGAIRASMDFKSPSSKMFHEQMERKSQRLMIGMPGTYIHLHTMFKRRYWSEPKRQKKTEKDTEKDTEQPKSSRASNLVSGLIG